MKKWFSNFLAGTSEQGRVVFRIALIMIVGALPALPVLALAKINAWQIYAGEAGLVFTCLIGISSALLARQGRTGLAVGLLIGNVFFVIPLMTALFSGLGLVLSLTLFLVTTLIVAQTLSGRLATFTLLMGVIFSVLNLIEDQFANWERLSFPQLQVLAPYIVAGVLVSLVYFVVGQFSTYSLRTKLLIGGLTLTLLAVGVLATTNYYNNRSNLQENSGQALKSVADSQALAVGDILLQETHVLQSFALSKVVQDRVDEVNASYGSDKIFNLQQIQALDKQWRAADRANNNNAPLVSGVLNSDVASELIEFRNAFPENAEVFVTDKYGANVAATNRTSDYYQADEDWWQFAYNKGQGAIYLGQPEFDRSSKTFGIVMAVPLYGHGTREVTGVLRTTLNINAIVTSLNTKVLNGTGHINLYLPSGQVLAPENSTGDRPADSHALSVLPALTTSQAYTTFTLDGTPSVVSATRVTSEDVDEKPAVQNLGWVIMVSQSEADNQAPIRQQTESTIVVALIILALSAVFAIFLAQLVSGPIVRLTAVAEQISRGDNTAQAKVETGDEIGKLAVSFNTMTSQLRETLEGLEQRVAARTKDLAIVAEVGTATATILESKSLLQEVVDLTKERFNLYHSHIYLLDEDGNNLVLAAGAGEPGRVMAAEGRSIPLNREQSLVARAARERQGVTVNDVTQSPDFLPNPLLPDTRSELAVPMIVGGNVIGVFDIQSEQVGRFTNSDINIQTTLAAQLAASIQNVRSFEKSRKQAELESMVNTIGQKIQRTTSIEETLQTAIRELGTAIGASRVKASISASKNGND